MASEPRLSQPASIADVACARDRILASLSPSSGRLIAGGAVQASVHAVAHRGIAPTSGAGRTRQRASGQTDHALRCAVEATWPEADFAHEMGGSNRPDNCERPESFHSIGARKSPSRLGTLCAVGHADSVSARGASRGDVNWIRSSWTAFRVRQFSCFARFSGLAATPFEWAVAQSSTRSLTLHVTVMRRAGGRSSSTQSVAGQPLTRVRGDKTCA